MFGKKINVDAEIITKKNASISRGLIIGVFLALIVIAVGYNIIFSNNSDNIEEQANQAVQESEQEVKKEVQKVEEQSVQSPVENELPQLMTKTELEAFVKKAGFTMEEFEDIEFNKFNKISEETSLDECPEKDIQGWCAVAWELTYKKSIPEGKERFCDVVEIEEYKGLCKSAMSKSLTQLEEDFVKLKTEHDASVVTMEEFEDINNKFIKISEETSLDECPEKDIQGWCAVAWELTYKKSIPEEKGKFCDILEVEEYKGLCKSAMSKSLTQLEEDFVKLKI
jgi:hypothetical protein